MTAPLVSRESRYTAPALGAAVVVAARADGEVRDPVAVQVAERREREAELIARTERVECREPAVRVRHLLRAAMTTSPAAPTVSNEAATAAASHARHVVAPRPAYSSGARSWALRGCYAFRAYGVS